MRAVQIALLALLSFIAGSVFTTFAVPVENLDKFVLSMGSIAVVMSSLLWVQFLMNNRHRSARSGDSDQSDRAVGAQQSSAWIKKDKGARSVLDVLEMLTFAATEAAKCAADATRHAAIASRRASTAAQGAVGKSMETVAEAAAAAAAEASYAAKHAVAAAKAAMKVVAATVEHRADISMLKAETQAAAAVKQASESAADAVRMAHAATASRRTES